MKQLLKIKLKLLVLWLDLKWLIVKINLLALKIGNWFVMLQLPNLMTEDNLFNFKI